MIFEEVVPDIYVLGFGMLDMVSRDSNYAFGITQNENLLEITPIVS